MHETQIFPGDSTEQKEAETLLVTELGNSLGLVLSKKRFTLSDGSWLEIDGACESPSVLCEAWARQGRPKSAQKNKVLADAFKLLHAAQLVPGPARLILVFGDGEAAAHFLGRSWMAQALKARGIEIHVVDLPADVRASIQAAQRRQFR